MTIKQRWLGWLYLQPTQQKTQGSRHGVTQELLTEDYAGHGMEERCVLEVVEIVLSELLATDEVFLVPGRWRQQPHKYMESKEESHLDPKNGVPVVLLDPLIIVVINTPLEEIVVKPGASCLYSRTERVSGSHSMLLRDYCLLRRHIYV